MFKKNRSLALDKNMYARRTIFNVLLLLGFIFQISSISNCHFDENEILCHPSEFEHYISTSINTSLFSASQTLHLTNSYYSGILPDGINKLIIDEYSYETFSLPFMSTVNSLTIEHTDLNEFPAWLCAHNTNLSFIEIDYSHLERILNHDLHLCLNLHTLHISHSNLKQLTSSYASQLSVYYLDLSHNHLEEISSKNGLNLNPFPQLRILDLSNNQMKRISSENFNQTSSLTSLDLCFNQLQSMELNHPKYLSSLEILDLKGNNDLQINKNWSNYFPHLVKISFPYAHFCCHYKNHLKISNDKSSKIYPNDKDQQNQFLLMSFHSDQICFPLPSPMTSCESLFSSKFVRLLFFMIVFVSVFSNLTTLIITIYRLVTSSYNRWLISILFSSNLALADFISSIYLILVGIIDIHFDENFYTKTQLWTNSYLCTLAGFIYIFGIQSSIYALTLLTFERFYTILFSFKRQTPWPPKFTRTIISIGWLISLFIASLPLVNVNNFHANSLCVPFRLETIFDRLYLSLLILVDLCFIGIIITCNGLICFNFSKSHVRTINDARATLKILTLVIAICISRIPLIIFIFLTLIINPDVQNYRLDFNHIKLAILFLQPFSSCFNPFMYSSLLTLRWTRTTGDFERPIPVGNSIEFTRFRSKSVSSNRGYRPLRMMSITSLDSRHSSAPNT